VDQIIKSGKDIKIS